MTNETKKLADQMVADIKIDIENELKSADKMGNSKEVIPVVETKPNSLVDGILEWGNQLDLDKIEPNSVLMIKVNSDDAEYAYKFQMGVIKHIVEPRFEALKAKKITVLFLSDKDDISVLTEKDMEKSGWIRREPSRIITL